MEQTCRFRFAGFELDTELGLLSRDGVAIHVSHKPFCALALLVTRDGALVTRDELQREIWRDGVHVNFEHGLNECIRQVRAALGDEDESKRIVLTYPRRGYRINVPIERLDPPVLREGGGAAIEVHSGPEMMEACEIGAAAGPPVAAGRRLPVVQEWLGAAALVAAMAAGFTFWRLAPVTQARPTDSSVAAASRMAAGDLGDAVSRPIAASPLLQPPAAMEAGEARVWYGRALANADHVWYPESVQTVQYLERAVALDPGFGGAHARLAIAYSEQMAAGLDPVRSRARARHALEAAMRVASSPADTRVASAEVKFRLDDDYMGAERLFTEAISISPTSALSHLRYAMFLQKQLRFDEAIAELRDAERLDPSSLRARWELGYVLFLSGRCQDALVQLAHALELDPNHAKSYKTRGQCFEVMGRQSEALEAYQAAGRMGLSHLGGMYARTGRAADARKILASLLQQPSRHDSGYVPLEVAYLYSELGDRAKVLQYIRQMQSRGVQLPIALRIAPEWTPLRSDAKFKEIEATIEGARATPLQFGSVHDRS